MSGPFGYGGNFTKNTPQTNKKGGKNILGAIGSVLGGPVGGLIGTLGSSLLSNIGARKRQATADQKNVEFWRMQNQYNLPSAQMQRLKDAGLNPNLIYGSSPAAASGSAGSISPSKAAPYSIANPVPSAISTAITGPQIANMKADAYLKFKQAATSDATKRAIDAKLPIEVENLTQTGNSLKQKALQEVLNTSKLKKTTKDDIKISASNVLKAKSQADLAQAEANLKTKLLKHNINPNAGLGAAIMQSVSGSVIDIIDFMLGGN